MTGKEKMMTSDEYFVRGGSLCPNCGSKNMEGTGKSNTDDTWHSEGILCLDCKATWDDIYDLSGYDNLQVPKEAA